MIAGMRCIGIAIGAMALVLASSVAHADKAGSPLRLVEAGARYHYVAQTVPLPAERYAQVALYDLDQPTVPGTRPLVLENSASAPEGWPTGPLHEQGGLLGEAPLASMDGESCNCKTVISDARRERVAALYAQHRFVLPAASDVQQYGLVQLRVAYRDGLRAYLNGHLIATRNLATGADATPQAARARGPEWEEFVVPLVPGLLRAGDNVLSLEVRPSANANGARFDAELTLRRGHELVRGPLLQRVDASSATIRFDTDLPTRAVVEFGKSVDLGSTAISASGALARHHEVKLAGLEAGQVVHYRLVVEGRPLEIQSFHLPPGPKEPLRFAVYGDMRGGHRVHAQIVESLLDEAIDFVIVTGDLVLRGSDEADWQRFFEVARPLLARIPYYPVVGNHDLGKTGDELRRFNELFALWPGPSEQPEHASWHSFDLSGVHFVMLDSNSYQSHEQLAWLEADLRDAQKRSRAVFAAVHAGPFSRGLHKGDQYAAEHYAPLLSAYGVTLLFSGHDHLYQRGRAGGLNYMVSGGGGAPLYSVTCGVKGRPRCKLDDGMQKVAKEHHYILVTVYPGYVSACPKRIDRTPLEACLRYNLPVDD